MSIRKLTARLLSPLQLRSRHAWWLLRRGLGLRERIPGNEKLRVVLLSFRRMRNLRFIVDSLLLCDFVDEIVLSNNNADVTMEDFVPARDPRLRIINQPINCFPGNRYDLARASKAPYCLAIDDDLFLAPGQIRKLFQALLADPTVPYGAGGENFVMENSRIVDRRIVQGFDGETDVIMWAYACTQEHIENYFRILDRLHIDNRTLKSSEDIVISFAGKGRARCVDLGRLLTCASSFTRGVATWRQDGFAEHRCDLYRQCRNAAESNT